MVDDRPDNLFSIETILEPDGYIFVKANSGKQALKILLKEYDFALILMDVKMPVLSGLETATLIYEREKLRHIPIVFITAHTYEDDNIFMGYKAGAVDYIYKPINPDLLRAKVAVFIDLYKKTHKLLAQETKLKAANERLENEIEERIKSEEQVKQLNVQLIENIIQLKATNEELDHFAYIASHDLQEPLRKIRTFSDLLVARFSKSLDNQAIDYLGKIDKSSQRMQLLIEDILSLSRFSNNSDDFCTTNLNDLLNSVVGELDYDEEEKNAVIKISALDTLPVIPSLFMQLFQNLIINAMKFRQPGVNPFVKISGEKVKGNTIPNLPADLHDKDYYSIRVIDNGIGFDEEYAEHIFVIFKRLHNSQNFQGTGIGLAICKKVVEKHNGYIYAVSQVGKGSTFTVSLPLQQN